MERGENVPAISSVEHLDGTQAEMDAVILSRPVVHWHSVSVSEHPASGTAVAKHASCRNRQSGQVTHCGGGRCVGCRGGADKGHSSRALCGVGIVAWDAAV
jgi:hypothetical protein